MHSRNEMAPAGTKGIVKFFSFEDSGRNNYLRFFFVSYPIDSLIHESFSIDWQTTDTKSQPHLIKLKRNSIPNFQNLKNTRYIFFFSVLYLTHNIDSHLPKSHTCRQNLTYAN
ncbi:hypothetical protein CEXT_86191 [Caerostris extrusa]|uniref:Uncharacterized protein n=1 Tax=Caerostris extrusa TaxID=172846 RepID=A0AAV4WQA7_CAEEX|nr:hypothetical protein CEXT_86191 [Caerostris extrusa]